MFFRLNGDLPPEATIARISLMIEPAGASTQQFTMPLTDEAVVYRRSDFLEVEFVWQFLAASDIPDLFGEVRYVWTLALDDGYTESIEGTVEFIDKRFEWRTNEAPVLFTTIRHPEGELNSDRLLRSLEEPYQRLRENTRQIEELTFVYYPPETEFGCYEQDEDGVFISTNTFYEITLPCDPALAETIYEQAPDIILRQPQLIGTTTSQLIDIYVEQFYQPDWQNADVPAWFQVGLARLYDPNNNATLYAEIELAARSNTLLSLNELQTRPPVDSETYSLWEAQSYGLVLYTAEQAGLDAVFELASTVDDYNAFDEAYTALVGEPITTIYPTWQTWIFTDAALRTFTLNLYGFPTPTPTRVLSPTPTWTRLPTSTPTDTPTITLTPSITPTFTPEPPTATFTPRPARSVFTPTPTFTPVPALQAYTDFTTYTTAQFVFLGLIVVALIVILLAAVASLTRR